MAAVGKRTKINILPLLLGGLGGEGWGEEAPLFRPFPFPSHSRPFTVKETACLLLRSIIERLQARARRAREGDSVVATAPFFRRPTSTARTRMLMQKRWLPAGITPHAGLDPIPIHQSPCPRPLHPPEIRGIYPARNHTPAEKRNARFTPSVGPGILSPEGLREI